jgi:hypothetical protein
MRRRAYADAFSQSGSFVSAFPAEFTAHAAMGESLLALNRTEEAVAVLRVSHRLMGMSAHTGDRSESRLRVLEVLGEALYGSGEYVLAEEVYKDAVGVVGVVGVVGDSSDIPHCSLLVRLGDLQSLLKKTHEAYVTLLSAVSHCAEEKGEASLLLGRPRRTPMHLCFRYIALSDRNNHNVSSTIYPTLYTVLNTIYQAWCSANWDFETTHCAASSWRLALQRYSHRRGR